MRSRQFAVVLGPAVVTIALAAIVATTLRGLDGLWGALLGGALVVVFLGSTPLILKPVVAASTAFSMPAALGFFTLKAVTAVAVMIVLFDVNGVGQLIDASSLGLTALATSMVWTVTATIAFRRERTPIFDLPDDLQ